MEVDVDLVKSDIRDLVERISSTMKGILLISRKKIDFEIFFIKYPFHEKIERDEGLHQVVTLKRQNDDLLEHTVQLEDQVVTLTDDA